MLYPRENLTRKKMKCVKENLLHVAKIISFSGSRRGQALSLPQALIVFAIKCV